MLSGIPLTSHDGENRVLVARGLQLFSNDMPAMIYAQASALRQ